MDRQRPVRIGQIGIGHNHAAETMRTIRRLPDQFELVGIAEPDPDWRARRGGDPAYDQLCWMTEEELLSIDDLDAVAVETDVPDLCATALRCLRAGVHIQMDKPGGETFREFRAVIDEARARSLTVHMGYMFRTNPAVRFCIDAVRDRMLGEVFEIDAVMSRRADTEYRTWLSQFGGGALYIFGGHLIDLVLAMLGRPDSIVPLSRRAHPHLDSLMDNGLAVLEYPHATAVVRTTVIEVEGFLRRQLVVCGDRGTIEIYPIEPFNVPGKTHPTLRLALAEPHGTFKAGFQNMTFPRMRGRYDAQLVEFADIIRGGIENPWPLEHELLLHECTLRACGYPMDAVQVTPPRKGDDR